MCLAIPVRVVELRGEDTAVVDLDGIRKEISLALVDDVQVGDYVILHVGYALSQARPRGGRAHAGAVCRAAEGAGIAAGPGRMKYIDEFRDGALARNLAASIAAEADPARRYNLMEFCGGHTHAISRYGVADLLPAPVRMIHGPGCPVCVLPIGRIDLAIRLALDRGVILCTYGDCLRVPASDNLSLLKAKARGGDVRMVYSPADALKAAQSTTRSARWCSSPSASRPPRRRPRWSSARRRAWGSPNFSVLCNHVLTPAAITNILESPEVRELGTLPLDGFIGPAHVSTIIGSQPYEFFAEEYRKPVVIAGFEPLDVMQAILMLVRQINEGRAEVENEFSRAVTRDGNLKAQALVSEVFELRRSFEWRGLGQVPYSALRIREAFAAFDAERASRSKPARCADNKACECGAILRGVKHPRDCKVFGTVCTPENPIGSCMVSSEGACAAYYSYGRFKDVADRRRRQRRRLPDDLPVAASGRRDGSRDRTRAASTPDCLVLSHINCQPVRSAENHFGHSGCRPRGSVCRASVTACRRTESCGCIADLCASITHRASQPWRWGVDRGAGAADRPAWRMPVHAQSETAAAAPAAEGKVPRLPRRRGHEVGRRQVDGRAGRRLRRSAHRKLDCADCHDAALSTRHPKNPLGPVKPQVCQDCHADEFKADRRQHPRPPCQRRQGHQGLHRLPRQPAPGLQGR